MVVRIVKSMKTKISGFVRYTVDGFRSLTFLRMLGLWFKIMLLLCQFLLGVMVGSSLQEQRYVTVVESCVNQLENVYSTGLLEEKCDAACKGLSVILNGAVVARGSELVRMTSDGGRSNACSCIYEAANE